VRAVRLFVQLTVPFLEKIVEPRPFFSAVFAGPVVGPEIPAVDEADRVTVVTPPAPHLVIKVVRMIYGFIPVRAGATFTACLYDNDPEVQVRGRFYETGGGVKAGH